MNSRIRRRNKCGFKGVGTPSVGKVTEYGDYRDVKQNYKVISNPEQYNMVRRLRKIFPFMKHIGSRSMSALRMYFK